MKKCPECGSGYIGILGLIPDNGTASHRVGCHKCGWKAGPFPTEAEAIASWERKDTTMSRPDTLLDDLQAAAANLQSRLDLQDDHFLEEAIVAIHRAEAEIRRLQAQATTYWVERDAVIDMCILTHVESGERWSFVGDFDKIPYVSMIKSMTKADAIRAVRIAAGLDHDAMTIEEVDAELARRGIDITPAWAKVKAALEKARAALAKPAN